MYTSFNCCEVTPVERLKNLFKKAKAQDKQVVQGFEPGAPTGAEVDASPEASSATDADKKVKHGQPGTCCGSCSN
nr:CCGSCS motif protein [Halomonas aerodenitrificans]